MNEVCAAFKSHSASFIKSNEIKVIFIIQKLLFRNRNIEQPSNFIYPLGIVYSLIGMNRTI